MQYHNDADPCRRFFSLLAAAISSGRAHVASAKGSQPDELPEAWGWRRRDHGGRDWEAATWDPNGRCIGWIDGQSLFLDQQAAYAAANMLSDEQGDTLGVTPATLYKRLSESGVLRSKDNGRDRLTIRRTLAGVRRTVLHVSAAAIHRDEKTVPPVPPGPTEKKTGKNGTVSGDGLKDTPENRPTKPAHLAAGNPADGPNGTVGTACEISNVLANNPAHAFRATKKREAF
jgi:hypothetical protein